MTLALCLHLVLFSHTCCHDLTSRFEVDVISKGCEARNHVINENPDSNKGKQRVKVSEIDDAREAIVCD